MNGKIRPIAYVEKIIEELAPVTTSIEIALRCNKQGYVDDAGSQVMKVTIPQARMPGANKQAVKS